MFGLFKSKEHDPFCEHDLIIKDYYKHPYYYEWTGCYGGKHSDKKHCTGRILECTKCRDVFKDNEYEGYKYNARKASYLK